MNFELEYLKSKIQELQSVNEFLLSTLKLEVKYSDFVHKNLLVKDFYNFVNQTRKPLFLKTLKNNKNNILSVEFTIDEDIERITYIYIKNIDKSFTFCENPFTNNSLYYCCEEEYDEYSYSYDMYIKKEEDSYVAELNGEKYYLKT